MPRSARSLSAWRHFAVTWGLPDDFGGMTSVIFRRSAGFARAGAPVTVLTFDDRLDTGRFTADLRARGVIAPDVTVLHLWDWLAAHPVRASDGVGDLPFAPIESPGDDRSPGSPSGDLVSETVLDGVVRRRERRAPDGAVLQVDRYRPDGSLLASDLRDTDQHGRPGGRAVVVCDTDGRPVAGWTSVWGLYRHWLDLVTDGQRSMLVVDSKTAARFVVGYRRRHVATVHVLHSAHRSADGEPGRPIKASRRDVLAKSHKFDAIVALTERQRSDLEADLPRARVVVVPNPGPDAPAPRVPLTRPAHRGVVVASLTSRKRVGDAVAAAVSAGVPLDVYGDGPDRAALLERLRVAGAETVVRLHGHHPDARRAFREASFSLLTSTSEGAPLVLLESMAAGCIPIAYDVRYGPRDMIRDGVDGFVVPRGDVEAVAARIREIVGMPEHRRRRMRRAGRRAAARYGEARVTKQWSALFADIAARRWPVAGRTRGAVSPRSGRARAPWPGTWRRRPRAAAPPPSAIRRRERFRPRR